MSVRKKINRKYVSSIWHPLSDCTHVDSALFALNLNNLSSIDRVVGEAILPEYKKMPLFMRVRVKDSLKYAINFYSDGELVRCYEAAIPEIDSPATISIRDFYKLVWERMFSSEDWRCDDKDQYFCIPVSDIYTE